MSKYYVTLRTQTVEKFEITADNAEKAVELAKIEREITTGNESESILRETSEVRDDSYTVVLAKYKERRGNGRNDAE